MVYFGVDDERHALPGVEHAADSKWCPRCNVNYHYTLSFYGHVGHYACPRCDWRRPTPAVRAVRVDLRGFAGTDVEIDTPAGRMVAHLSVPGLYNVYNALAATAAALSLGVPLDLVQAGLEKTTAAFGRMERLEIGGKTVFILLVKNPTGLNQVIRALLAEPGPKNLVFMLNDNIADGRDVSWIWDVDFERLAGQVRTLVCSGTRAEDMALRLKLAGATGNPTLPLPVTGQGAVVSSSPGDPTGVSATTGDPGDGDRLGPGYVVEKDLGRALEQGLANTEPGGTLYFAPTYTAMLDLRRELVRLGYVTHFLESK